MGTHQPKISIQNTFKDHLINTLTVIALLGTYILPIIYLNELPEEIPTHFNGLGAPDDYSSKNTIWLLCIISTLITIGLFWLKNKPHILNYPLTITNDNAVQVYRITKTMLGLLALFIVIAFLYITYQSIAMALGKSVGLGKWFLPVFIGSILLIIGYSFTQMNKTYNA